jgi:hypothetical protein
MFRKSLILFSLLFCLIVQLPAFANEMGYIPDEVLVRFKPKSNNIQKSTEEKSVVLSSLGGGTITQNYKIIPGLCLVKLPAGTSVKSALSAGAVIRAAADIRPGP